MSNYCFACGNWPDTCKCSLLCSTSSTDKPLSVYRVKAWRQPNEDWPTWSIALQRAAPPLPVLSDQTALWRATGRLGR